MKTKSRYLFEDEVAKGPVKVHKKVFFGVILMCDLGSSQEI